MSCPSRPLRILLVPALTEASGATLLAARLARRLDPAQFECRLALPAPGEFAERLRAEGLRVDTLALQTTRWRDAAGARGKLRWLASRFAYVHGLYQLVIRHRTDVVYVHSAIQPLAALTARLRGLPVVWHVHEFLEPGRPGAARQRMCVRRLARTVIFCGWAARRSFGRTPPGRRWVVIPNAVAAEIPPDRRSAIRAEVRNKLNIKENDFVVITVGRVQPGKGLDLLAEALGRCTALREAAGAFRLLVAGDAGAGDNPYLRRVMELLGHAGLRVDGAIPGLKISPAAQSAGREGESGCVTFLGYREDVPRCLAAADVFVLPSRSEAFPLSLLEAFAVGLPAVVTDVGDCRLLVGESRRGLCVPRENPDALAKALEQVYRNPDLRETLGRNARRLVETRFSEEVFLDRISRVLRRAAGHPRDQEAPR